MVIAYSSAWPVNRWLIRKGWKEKMDARRHVGQMVERTESAEAA